MTGQPVLCHESATDDPLSLTRLRSGVLNVGMLGSLRDMGRCLPAVGADGDSRRARGVALDISVSPRRFRFAQQAFDMVNQTMRLGQSCQRQICGTSHWLENPAMKYLLLFLLVALLLAGCGSSEPLYNGQPLSAFIAGIDSPDPALQAYAQNTLVSFGAKDPKIVPALITAMKGGSFNAANLLAQIGPLSERKGDVIAALGEVVKTQKKSISLRIAATNALPKFGPDAKPAVPVLIEMLAENDENMQEQAAKTLGKLRETASEAVEPLAHVARTSSPLAQRAALAALKEIDETAYNKMLRPF